MAALAQGRAKREQKPVERLTAAADEKEDKALEIPQGSGSRLGDLDNVEFRIGKTLATSDELKNLHRFCYGKPGAKATIKKNLRSFSGFVFADQAAPLARCTGAARAHTRSTTGGRAGEEEAVGAQVRQQAHQEDARGLRPAGHGHQGELTRCAGPRPPRRRRRRAHPCAAHLRRTTSPTACWSF